MKKLLIQSLFIAALVVSNVVAGKVLNIFGFIVPGAFLLYAITFLMTDLTSELWGKKEAIKLVQTGFICSLFAAGMIYLTQLMPSPPFAQAQADAYKVLLGMNFRLVMASMIAYYLSQSWDVWFFHKLGSFTKGKHKWLRNNASTMTSQLIDTSIFITIAFAGIVPDLWWMIISQYVLKLIIAAVDTPFFYLFTKGKTGEFEGTALETS